jgi:hypothetical protein
MNIDRVYTQEGRLESGGGGNSNVDTSMGEVRVYYNSGAASILLAQVNYAFA